jgi:hypothetical protein
MRASAATTADASSLKRVIIWRLSTCAGERSSKSPGDHPAAFRSRPFDRMMKIKKN